MKATKINKALARSTNITDNIKQMAYQLNARMCIYESKCHFVLSPIVYRRFSDNILNITAIISDQIDNR